MPPKAPWHTLSVDSAAAALSTDSKEGLSEAEAARRLAVQGPNELERSSGTNPWKLFVEQLTSVLVLILIAAAAISFLLQDYRDATTILAIVVLNAILGFVQEYRAEKALAALRKLAVPRVSVRRGGRLREIPAQELVPGDLLILEAGNLVAADGRLLECNDVQIQEAALTGESQPVRKTADTLQDPELALADRRNMVYLGTLVTAGRGVATVASTGMHTELGRIARMIQRVEREPTPLQKRLERLGKILAAATCLIVIFVFILGLLRGVDLKLMLLTAVSIGVAAVPEGLPAVVTIALTIGAQRMLRRKALIRKLPAVETLGSVTIICSDKTGTLTENRMMAAVLALPDWEIHLPSAQESSTTLAQAALSHPGLALLLAGGALCNNAIESSRPQAGDGPSISHGDPTELALLRAAALSGLDKDRLDRIFPRTSEIAFSSQRKRMSTVHRLPSESAAMPQALRPALGESGYANVVFLKGSVENAVALSTSLWLGRTREPLTPQWRERLLAVNEALARKGMRVLGVAFRLADSLPTGAMPETMEQGFTFVGMAGLMDPPRPESSLAIRTCKSAGIRPLMVTGDHPLTAGYIGAQIGITESGRAITGQELEGISAEALETRFDSVAIFARVSPEHKLKIVESLQHRGEIVAMTGDGVNDAPALKKADIGVAMGEEGTEVAKEAADMVLLDDNFATIVAAVEEGRVIYDNVRKFIRYILATNSGEIGVMILAPLAGMPLPLLPLQILWMNLVTDGLPALALGVEPAEENIMRRPPHPPGESIFSRGLGRHVIWVGLLMSLLSLGIGYTYWIQKNENWQTILFTVLTVSQMAHVMAIRSERNSLFRIGLFSNRSLLGAVALTLLLQLAIIYLPFLQGIFRTTPLPLPDLAISFLLSSLIFWAVEGEKWLLRNGRKET